MLLWITELECYDERILYDRVDYHIKTKTKVRMNI